MSTTSDLDSRKSKSFFAWAIISTSMFLRSAYWYIFRGIEIEYDDMGEIKSGRHSDMSDRFVVWGVGWMICTMICFTIPIFFNLNGLSFVSSYLRASVILFPIVLLLNVYIHWRQKYGEWEYE